MRAQDEAVLAERRERIAARLDLSWQVEMAEPMLAGTNLRYEMAARVRQVEAMRAESNIPDLAPGPES